MAGWPVKCHFIAPKSVCRSVGKICENRIFGNPNVCPVILILGKEIELPVGALHNTKHRRTSRVEWAWDTSLRQAEDFWTTSLWTIFLYISLLRHEFLLCENLLYLEGPIVGKRETSWQSQKRISKTLAAALIKKGSQTPALPAMGFQLSALTEFTRGRLLWRRKVLKGEILPSCW